MSTGFTALQGAFADALFDPDHVVPEDIFLCHAVASSKRFNIYRNNVTVSLLDALTARFPVTYQIVGEDFFKTMARVFISRHPPRSPLMMFYGDELPGFIAEFEPAADLPYLGDVARLEAARTRAYHAQDYDPLDPAVLQTIDAQDLEHLHFTLHPSVEFISSPYPVVTIWAMHVGEMALGEITDWHAEEALIARPRLDVDVRLLPPGGAAFLKNLSDGQSLMEAAGTAAIAHQDFDLAVNLAGLFSAGLVVASSIA